MTQPKIINEWKTNEINPQEIAKYLHGELEASDDANSDWNIHLYYGRKTPLIIVKLDTGSGRMFLLVYKHRKRCIATISMMDIERLRFVTYKIRHKEHCDILFQGFGSSVVLSSYSHKNKFGTKEHRETTRQEYAQLMPLMEYLNHRDGFIMTKLYADLKDTARLASISDEDLDSKLRTAFLTASDEWHAAQSETHRRRVEASKV